MDVFSLFKGAKSLQVSIANLSEGSDLQGTCLSDVFGALQIDGRKFIRRHFLHPLFNHLTEEMCLESVADGRVMLLNPPYHKEKQWKLKLKNAGFVVKRAPPNFDAVLCKLPKSEPVTKKECEAFFDVARKLAAASIESAINPNTPAELRSFMLQILL